MIETQYVILEFRILTKLINIFNVGFYIQKPFWKPRKLFLIFSFNDQLKNYG